MLKKNREVVITDCSLRDGLSGVTYPVNTPDKAMLLEAIAASGLPRIECVTFHHPRLNPRNSDAEKVMASTTKREQVSYLGMVPDEIGCRRALTTEVDGVVTLVSASEDYNQAQLGQTIRETLNKTLPSIFESARKEGKDITTYIQTSFGCPYAGDIEPERIISLASGLVYLGATHLSFVDNTGMASPKQVKSLMSEVIALNLDAELGVHFHNTRGTALLNCLAAYEVGIRHFDTAIGGLSRQLVGTSVTEIGKGNVPTEDLVHVLEEMGIDTGIDLDALLRAVETAEKLAGHPLAGHILRAGPVGLLQNGPARFKYPRVGS